MQIYPKQDIDIFNMHYLVRQIIIIIIIIIIVIIRIITITIVIDIIIDTIIITDIIERLKNLKSKANKKNISLSEDIVAMGDLYFHKIWR